MSYHRTKLQSLDHLCYGIIAYFSQNGCIDFSETLHIVIYILIIYPASENSVTAMFPPRSRVASKRLRPNLRKVNIFRSQRGLHVLSWSHTSDLITLRPLLRYTHEVLSQLNYPRDRGDTVFEYLFNCQLQKDIRRSCGVLWNWVRLVIDDFRMRHWENPDLFCCVRRRWLYLKQYRLFCCVTCAGMHLTSLKYSRWMSLNFLPWLASVFWSSTKLGIKLKEAGSPTASSSFP